MRVLDYVKYILADPEMPDDFADAVLWGCTGYPSFWIEGPPIKCLTKQLRHAKRSLARGFTIDQIHMGEDKILPRRTG